MAAESFALADTKNSQAVDTTMMSPTSPCYEASTEKPFLVGRLLYTLLVGHKTEVAVDADVEMKRDSERAGSIEAHFVGPASSFQVQESPRICLEVVDYCERLERGEILRIVV